MSDYAHDLAKAFEEKVFDYLDELRDSGITNMFDATPYISSVFDVDRFEAEDLLKAWMMTFSRNKDT